MISFPILLLQYKYQLLNQLLCLLKALSFNSEVKGFLILNKIVKQMS